MSKLEVGSHNLAPVAYKDLLEAIARVLKQNESSIRINPSGIFFDLDHIANEVAKRFATSNRYPDEYGDGMIYSSIHAVDIQEKATFSDQIEALVVKELQKLLFTALQAQKYSSIEKYIQNLLKPIAEYSNKVDSGIKYPLTRTVELEKKRLRLQPKKINDTPWLKGHKLTLQIKDIRSFDKQVIDSICTSLEQLQVESEDIEDVRESLKEMAKKPKSPLNLLHDIVVKKSVARIQREAKLKYLVYLYQGLQEWKSSKKEDGMKLLNVIIKRLQLLDDYIRIESSEQRNDYGYFEVTYQNNIFNLRDLFARAEAFDPLPIITDIEGILGEATDQIQGTKTFTFGLKLKLNGPVQVHGGHGKSVYEFNLALLDPDGQEYKQREAEAELKSRFQEKVLRVALLYHFIFSEMDNEAFNPVSSFEAEILKPLREGTQQEKDRALQLLQQRIAYNIVKPKIDTLRNVLVEFLDHQSLGPARKKEPMVLSVSEQILVKDADSMVTHNIFFREAFDVNEGQGALKYITVEEANANKGSICKLPIEMLFAPMFYHPTDDPPEQFTMHYDTEGFKMLPIFLMPSRKLCKGEGVKERLQNREYRHRLFPLEEIVPFIQPQRRRTYACT